MRDHNGSRLQKYKRVSAGIAVLSTGIFLAGCGQSTEDASKDAVMNLGESAEKQGTESVEEQEVGSSGEQGAEYAGSVAAGIYSMIESLPQNVQQALEASRETENAEAFFDRFQAVTDRLENADIWTSSEAALSGEDSPGNATNMLGQIPGAQELMLSDGVYAVLIATADEEAMLDTAATPDDVATENMLAMSTSSDAAAMRKADVGAAAETLETAVEEDPQTRININDPSEDVDIDLFVMSPDMVYSTLTQIMTFPSDYIGKTIRIEGEFLAFWYEQTQQYYYYILVCDSTGTSQLGLEFIWEDGTHIYPDDYPGDGSDVIVEGGFEIYMEEGDPDFYCHLVDADMRVVWDSSVDEEEELYR